MKPVKSLPTGILYTSCLMLSFLFLTLSAPRAWSGNVALCDPLLGSYSTSIYQQCVQWNKQNCDTNPQAPPELVTACADHLMNFDKLVAKFPIIISMPGLTVCNPLSELQNILSGLKSASQTPLAWASDTYVASNNSGGGSFEYIGSIDTTIYSLILDILPDPYASSEAFSVQAFSQSGPVTVFDDFSIVLGGAIPYDTCLTAQALQAILEAGSDITVQ